MTEVSEKKQIVVVGGGFGGVYTALHLERLADPAEVDITLVSRHNFFLMTPLLFEAGSGVLEPRHAVSPIRPLLKRARFIEADVEAVDFEGRVVYARHSPTEVPYELPYDDVVLALGGVTNRALIPGSEHAMAFKTLAEAIAVRNHLIDMFEQADAETDPEVRAELLTFVVIGGGLVGIELMGEMTEFLTHLCDSYPRIRCDDMRFLVVEAGPRALAEMDPDLGDYAVKALGDRGVEVRVNVPVQAIEPRAVVVGQGERIGARTIVLAAGVGPNPLLAHFPLKRDRKGRVEVESTMKVSSHTGVWALGDCAAIPDPEGKPYPPLAQHALREARVLAENIVASIRGEALKPFVHENKGTLAALGQYAGVARLNLTARHTVKLRGFPAWWVWRTYYLLQMPRFDRRLRIMIDWTIALFFKYDVVKLDLQTEQDRVAAARAPRANELP
jgi:NADH dehydrogenase